MVSNYRIAFGVTTGLDDLPWFSWGRDVMVLLRSVLFCQEIHRCSFITACKIEASYSPASSKQNIDHYKYKTGCT